MGKYIVSVTKKSEIVVDAPNPKAAGDRARVILKLDNTARNETVKAR